MCEVRFCHETQRKKFAKTSVSEVSKIEKIAKISIREIHRSVIRENYLMGISF